MNEEIIKCLVESFDISEIYAHNLVKKHQKMIDEGREISESIFFLVDKIGELEDLPSREEEVDENDE